MSEPSEPPEGPAGEEPSPQPPEAEAAEQAEQAEAAGESGTADFEGPRRRARREREERRALAEKARALELARLEAKRKAHAVAEPSAAGPSRGMVRGFKAAVLGVLAAAVIVGLGLVLYFTPLMSVRDIVVVGVGEVTREQVVEAAAVPLETPLLQVDTDAVAARVAGIRRVASARVKREYPSSLRITIAERAPIAMRDFPDGPRLYDRDGVDFTSIAPPLNLPYLDVDNPGPNDPPTQAALEVLGSLGPDIAGQVGRVAAPSVSSVTLILTDGRVVIWGGADRTREKAAKLGPLLTQPGHTYDVSSPDLATVR
ncbi:cell division protein FtsQ/DivIB [Mycolicibacterium brumae]|uniref:Cell division protein FtsQ n=1 Tax=Mycolicibacterium brumae TaxID=85968 RepID=A0A2G5P755_9MYCO|nr:FtsQ-type POTRA domain-containing protein [Mycolicibacterium brumae]MCV7194654.1 FtsQ-type POTRA domain-containing protein [Mycolicibacterium brumae]PIB74096.1 cell division protein FtsQ [Mycolicibacterium brumae]RWA19134.1 hypothetical protein MBRU_17260 [Mycolicibacterium brumae DSM 44177]UWW08402.1 FtsQ-type POTRA domain-containing protein [Mycolicibacterium brumae]